MGKELRDFKDFTNEMDPLSRGDAIDSFEFVRRIHNSFAREIDLLNADMHFEQKAAKMKKKRAAAKGRETRDAKKADKTPLKEKSPNVTSTPARTSGRTSKKTEKIAKPDFAGSSPLSDPPDSESDFETPSKVKKSAEKSNEPRRRSERNPKPRKTTFAVSAIAAAEAEAEEGFHFIAYMPINGHVWKLDGP